MKKTIKKKWIAALLSGKYKQGRWHLIAADGKQYCCLGVLCRVVGARKVRGDDTFIWRGEIQSALLGSKLLKHVGLEWNQAAEAARLNDKGGERKSFEQIANDFVATL